MQKSLWSSKIAVGSASMDAAHKTLLNKLEQLAAASDADFPTHYAAMVARMESDFREEEALMEQIGYHGLAAHREQHAQLLGGLHRAAGAIMRGDVSLGRQLVDVLPQLIIFHISTMDAALSAAWQFCNESQELVQIKTA